MFQLSLLRDDNCALLAGLMPAVRASMRRVAGEPDGDGRKLLVDKMNRIANSAEIRITNGSVKSISKDTLDKWLSPSDASHPPSLLAVVVFCKATGDSSPLQIILQILGLDLMTAEDKKARDYGKAILDEKAARIKRRKIEQDMG